MERLLKMLLPWLAEELRRRADLSELCEIRLRLGQPVRLRLAREVELGRVWREQDMQEQLVRFTENSLYAFEEELRQGFLTLNGGHRVGLCGEAWYDGGRLGGFRDIGSLNVRVAREVRGVARAFLPYVVGAGRVRRVLIAAAPAVGKTTLLRDLARMLSAGEAGIAAQNVGIADERQEIAAFYQGKPQLDLGGRCDVVSGLAKAEALQLLLRVMSPDVLITDEIGTAADAAALKSALNSGVAVLASVHAGSYEELLARPNVGDLVLAGYFERVIFPIRQGGRLMARAVYDGSGERLV